MQVRGIRLSEAHERELIDRARAARPREACGLLLGRLVDGVALVERALAARNAAEGDESFEVDPRDHLAAQRDARAAGLDVIGAWHSHPRGPAALSERDAREAVPGWVTLIVDAEAPGWRAWIVAADRSWHELARGALRGGDPEQNRPS